MTGLLILTKIVDIDKGPSIHISMAQVETLALTYVLERGRMCRWAMTWGTDPALLPL